MNNDKIDALFVKLDDVASSDPNSKFFEIRRDYMRAIVAEWAREEMRDAQPSRLEFYAVVVKQDGHMCLGTVQPLSQEDAEWDAEDRSSKRSSTGTPLYEFARVARVTVLEEK